MVARVQTVDAKAREQRGMFMAATLTGIALLLLLIALFVVRDRANREQAAGEASAIRTALETARADFVEESRAFAEHLPTSQMLARTRATAPVRLAGPGGETLIVDSARDFAVRAADDPVLSAILKVAAPLAADRGVEGRLRGGLRPGARSTHWGAARDATVVAQGAAYLAVLIPYLGEADAHLALLRLRPLDALALGEIARTADTQRLDLVTVVGDDRTSIALALGDDGKAYDLAWRPRRPGDSIVDRNAFYLLAFAALFAVLIAAYSRRITAEAARGEERALAAVGQDTLTGLPNRALFLRLLDAEIGRVKGAISDRGAAVLLLDCDRFNEVNDSLGRQSADRLLVELARRIGGLLRSAGRLARLDGDEFAIIQTDLVGPRDAEMLARRILASLEEPFELDDRQVYLSMSIGVALCPHDACETDELMRRADLALYRAKNEGRNRFCFFEAKMGEELKLRKAVEDDLRSAIETGGLILQYQPVMEISGQRMVGVEALVRWPHPVHGLISPANFITLAEECGLILPLGEWVLRRALSDMRQWPGLKVAVNVSGIQFRQKDFAADLEKLIGEAGIDPERPELELTESVLLADADAAEDAMISLRAMGVRLALDDFGTGYSSLIYLRRFAFDKIKIDKSFLDSVEAVGESAIIVHSIVHLGRALGLTVTAEGVETADQHRFLQALACHELQGYLFSKPVAAAEITRRLQAQNAKAIAAEAPRAVA